ncbi:Bifunctional purine biosynthesis protein PurH [Marasmius sp. AFHP31]|nr:Bifunctional purine biosynthesis protein PurH [Marasmius sp. AFHP31]
MLTTYGWCCVLWVVVIPFQYGQHISILNQIHSAIACEVPPLSTSTLPPCFPMDNFVFSVVTSIFTIGGLLGSAFANVFMDRYGRRGTARMSAFCVALGSAIMGLGGGVTALSFGRFLVGIGSGIGICLGPVYIAEITPKNIAGTVGILTQLGIVLGIFITQLLGLYFASPSSWRFVFFFSFAVSAVQLFLSPSIAESPRWLRNISVHATQEAKAVERKLWTKNADSASDPLLDESDPEAHPAEPASHSPQTALTIPQILFNTPAEIRAPLIIVTCAMIGQQISGINAVLYYSNDILSQSLPELGKYVSLGITVVNVLMTFPPIFLSEKLGRKRLLMLSTSSALVCLLMVGIGLNNNWVTISSIFIVGFVMSFAIGLGPIPFVMIPEISPYHGVSGLSSIALTLNWFTNFVVGLFFLPLRNMLSGGDPNKQGRVFWVFAVALLVVMSVVGKMWKGH